MFKNLDPGGKWDGKRGNDLSVGQSGIDKETHDVNLGRKEDRSVGR